MIAAPEVVEEIIKESPYLESAMADGLINLSALARQIQPQIQKQLLKEIQIGAIIMALKRLERKLQTQKVKTTPLLTNLGDLTVKSNLMEFTFTNSPTLLSRHKDLLQKISSTRGIFLTLTQSVFQTSLIISAGLEREAEKIFQQEKLISKLTDLSAMTLNLSKETIKTPGIYYAILKTLAWHKVNIIEVVSSFTELTIVVESQDIDRAFSLLRNLSR